MSAPHYGIVGYEDGVSCPQCGNRDLCCADAPNPKPKPPANYPYYTGWSRTIRVYGCDSCGHGMNDYNEAVRSVRRERNTR